MSLFRYERSRMVGMVLAVVSNNQDPEKLGRIRVKFHMLDQQVESDWCRLVSPYAGSGRGMQWLPEEGDEVVLAFEHGDVNFPLVLGALHHGKARPPMPQNKDNNLKLIKTRSGHTLSFDDRKGQEFIRLIDSSGKNRIEIDVKKNSITIEAETGDLLLKAPKGTLTLSCKKLQITASESATLESKGTLSITSTKSATLTSRAELTLKASKAFAMESQTQGISLKASTALKGNASQLELKSTGRGTLQATADLVVKGSRVLIN